MDLSGIGAHFPPIGPFPRVCGGKGPLPQDTRPVSHPRHNSLPSGSLRYHFIDHDEQVGGLCNIVSIEIVLAVRRLPGAEFKPKSVDVLACVQGSAGTSEIY